MRRHSVGNMFSSKLIEDSSPWWSRAVTAALTLLHPNKRNARTSRQYGVRVRSFGRSRNRTSMQLPSICQAERWRRFTFAVVELDAPRRNPDACRNIGVPTGRHRLILFRKASLRKPPRWSALACRFLRPSKSVGEKTQNLPVAVEQHNVSHRETQGWMIRQQPAHESKKIRRCGRPERRVHPACEYLATRNEPVVASKKAGGLPRSRIAQPLLM